MRRLKMFTNESENTFQCCSLNEKINSNKNFYKTSGQHQHHHYYHNYHYHHHHHHYYNEQQKQQQYSYTQQQKNQQKLLFNQQKVKIWLSTGSINNVFLWLKDIKDKMKHRMRNRHRGPKYPQPTSSSSTTGAAPAKRADLSDSTYYASYDTDIDDYNSAYPGRRYIDPWDLENYEYVRRQLNLSPDRTSTTPPSPETGEQSMSSNFFYLPNDIEECPACCAGMDEQTFYNTKYETIIDDETTPYCSYTTEFESPGSGGSGGSSNSGSPIERNRSSTSSVSSLMLHTPGFGAAASGRRRLVLPKPAPRLEFPAPPPYDYCQSGPSSSCPACAYVPENNYYTLSSDCYECLSNPIENNPASSIYIPLSSIYGGIGGGSYIGVGSGSYGVSGGRSSLCSYNTYTSRFGLSKKGLLQIDYSCNWNDLDRLIGTKGL